MKNLLTSIALTLALATSAQADQCQDAGDLAEAVMTARQNGAPISQLMEIANGQEIIVKMVLMAYGEPRYSTDQFQSRAIEDFRNLWEVGCYQAMTEKGA